MRRIIVVALTLIALGPFTLRAQREGAKHVERPVPFKIGETLTYDVAWSSLVTAGTAAATIKEKKASFNSTAYYIVAEGRPTPIVAKLYSLYYKLDTLLDSYTLLPQRGSVYSEEGSRHRPSPSRRHEKPYGCSSHQPSNHERLWPSCHHRRFWQRASQTGDRSCKPLV